MGARCVYCGEKVLWSGSLSRNEAYGHTCTGIYTPQGTGDKMARLNSVSDIIASGLYGFHPKRWAEELVEEVAGFPFMSNDDLVDSTVMALLRFRQGGFVYRQMNGMMNRNIIIDVSIINSILRAQGASPTLSWALSFPPDDGVHTLLDE